MVKDLKLLVVYDKHGSRIDLELHLVNAGDRMGALPMLPHMSG